MAVLKFPDERKLRAVTRRLRTRATILNKRARRVLAAPVDSVPVFVFGKQRSGTTMLMDVFHNRHDTDVFDESAASRAFVDFRIRSFAVIEEIVAASKAPFVCFKPLADSHLMREFSSQFPNARMLWVYRHYADNARSSLKKFAHATRAIRLVCTDQSGGGWFQEGVSDETARVLRGIYRPDMTDLDLACMVWWARNRLAVELDLPSWSDVMLVRYEDLVGDPKRAFRELFEFIGMSYEESCFSRVVRLTPSRRRAPGLDPDVQRLCDRLLATLDQCVLGRRPAALRTGESAPSAASRVDR